MLNLNYLICNVVKADLIRYLLKHSTMIKNVCVDPLNLQQERVVAIYNIVSKFTQ